MKKPLVYIAGPIKSHPMHNAHNAIWMAWWLIKNTDVVPFCPHYSVYADTVAPMDNEDWMQYDFDVIRHCDAVYRMPGDSEGADREVELALELGLPVFGDGNLQSLVTWAREWKELHNVDRVPNEG